MRYSPPKYRLTVRSASGEFEARPWSEVINWGRCVKVESVDDIDAVHRLVAAPGDDQRALFFEWLNNVERQKLIYAIEATGLGLRPFDDRDKAAASIRPSGFARLSMVPALPYLLMMRFRGQQHRCTKYPRRTRSIDSHPTKPDGTDRLLPGVPNV